MVRKTILSAGLIAAAGMLAGAGNASASVVQPFYASGAYVYDHTYTLSASIDFTTSAGTVAVVINNTSEMHAINEAIYGITFDLSGGVTAAPSLDPTLAVGQQITLNKSGPTVTADPVSSQSYENGAGGIYSVLKHPWTASVGTGAITTYSLMIDASKPADLVSSDNFTNPDGSLWSHSPLLATGASFTMDIAGILSSTTVSNVVVYYGTSGSTTSATPLGSVPAGGPLPIPATLPLVGGGLLGLGLIALRKRRRLSQSR